MDEHYRAMYPEITRFFERRELFDVLDRLLAASQQPTIYEITDYHWLVVHECLQVFCDLHNDDALGSDGEVGPYVIDTIDFEALVSRFFWDTDFCMGAVLLRAEERKPGRVQASRQAWKIAAGLRPDPEDLRIVPLRIDGDSARRRVRYELTKGSQTGLGGGFADSGWTNREAVKNATRRPISDGRRRSTRLQRVGATAMVGRESGNGLSDAVASTDRDDFFPLVRVDTLYRDGHAENHRLLSPCFQSDADPSPRQPHANHVAVRRHQRLIVRGVGNVVEFDAEPVPRSAPGRTPHRVPS